MTTWTFNAARAAQWSWLGHCGLRQKTLTLKSGADLFPGKGGRWGEHKDTNKTETKKSKCVSEWCCIAKVDIDTVSERH